MKETSTYQTRKQGKDVGEDLGYKQNGRVHERDLLLCIYKKLKTLWIKYLYIVSAHRS